jgi:hypothetical protein
MAQSGPKMNIQDDDTMSVNRALLSLDYSSECFVLQFSFDTYPLRIRKRRDFGLLERGRRRIQEAQG